MADKKEYVEVEGIKCEVKDPSRKATVIFYQESLKPEIDKYISHNIMTEKRQNYANALMVNVKIAPFVLGWLKKPEDEDEYRVIKGLMTIDELNTKRKKESRKSTAKPVAKKTKPKESETKKAPTPKATSKKPVESSKTIKKATLEDAEIVSTKKAAPKKTAPKNPPKKK